ncbi:MAG: GNAT family N-acetyltransferase [Oscillochloridaceae bacterium umkhey_bin13]
MNIRYQHTLEDVNADHLHGFFVGWPSPPSPATHLRLLQGSQHVILARDSATGQVVGFITALSDGVLSAYIPHLEVLPAYQGQGIGSTLVRNMLAQLHALYMIDLICDPPVQPFYARLGLRPWSGMVVRNYDRQSGEALPERNNP